MALLVIDMQNGFVHPESGMGRSLFGVESQQNIVPQIIKVIKFCRENEIPVIWSQQEHFIEDSTRSRRKLHSHVQKQGFLPCLRGTWETEFFFPLKEEMEPKDHLVVKHRASVFFQTNLETKLKMLGTSCLIITGCNTEFCVESTVRDAYARDFDVILIRDAVAGIQPRFHLHSLEVMAAYFAEVLDLKDLQLICSNEK